MKKFFSLFLALCLCFSISHAATYQAKVSNITYNTSQSRYDKGSVLSTSGAPVKVYLDKNALIRSTADQTYLPDNTRISTYGTSSIVCNGNTSEGTYIVLEVSEKVKNLKIYYTGAQRTERYIRLEEQGSKKIIDLVYSKGPTLYNSSGTGEYSHLVTLDRLAPGNYYLYSPNFTGGFVGLSYESMTSSQPGTTTNKQPTSISDSKTWDFADVTANVNASQSGKDYQANNDNDYASYAYFYSRNNRYSNWAYQYTLTYNEDFDGKTIAFAGEYPIKDNSYTQNGTVMFRTTVDGFVRVTFTDTGTGATNDAYRRYLAVNGERSEYWTSRENNSSDGAYAESLNVTSGLIPVSAGEVYINGLKEDGQSKAPIRVSKVEFFKISDKDPGAGGSALMGITNDTFSQRIYYYEDGRSTSKWTYGGYKQSTHGLSGGVDDNGIIYVSSDFWDTKTSPQDNNHNGNITFHAPGEDDPDYWLSCSYGSTVYVPVNANTSGTITITCTQKDYSGNSKGDRYFELQKEGSTSVRGNLPLDLTSSLNYTASDISTYNGKTYLKLVSHFDEDYWKTYNGQYAYKGEMKVYTITVAMDRNNNNNTDFEIEEPETDYDHEIGEDHTHALFNWTQGDVYTEGFHYGTLTTRNGAVLTGTDPAGSSTSSKTETIHSYRNGDIVKYKTNYYGGLQLLSDPVKYTIQAPAGYYITTSVRLHGHNNQNYQNTDEDKSHFVDTYISNFNGGVFNADSEKLGLGNDDTYMKFARDDTNARTTTLDFTVPASESVDFMVSGYQIFGVIDAVLVPQESVPTLAGKVFYEHEQIIGHVDITEFTKLRYQGTITYIPQGDEELWWYFEPSEKIESRGCFSYTSNENIDDFPVESEGTKDQNFTKTFSVRNYKFVNTPGLVVNDVNVNTLNGVYDKEENYLIDSGTSTQSNIRTLADSDNPNGVKINVTEPGTYYFYLRDPVTKYNSVLDIKTFDTTTGIEDIVVEDTYETDELNAPVYNVYGQRVGADYRGVVIKNGKKYIRK